MTALSTWLGLSGIGACRGSVGWVSVVWVRLRPGARRAPNTTRLSDPQRIQPHTCHTTCPIGANCDDSIQHALIVHIGGRRISRILAAIIPIETETSLAVTRWLAFTQTAILDWIDNPVISRRQLHELCMRTLGAAVRLPN
jgi:hypothetical protein